MKRTIRILSYIGLAIATTALIVLFSSSIPLPQSNNAVALAKPFNDFPPDKPQFIDYRLDELSFEQLTKREKQDQLRDWLLFTIVSDKDLSTEEINQSLYDVSTTRQGYMRPVSNFEYGMSRSLYVGEGEVVALIPAKLKADQRNDALAHIADKHRKDLGEKPTNLLVFEYELNSAEQYAWLTRREVIDAAALVVLEAQFYIAARGDGDRVRERFRLIVKRLRHFFGTLKKEVGGNERRARVLLEAEFLRHHHPNFLRERVLPGLVVNVARGQHAQPFRLRELGETPVRAGLKTEGRILEFHEKIFFAKGGF